jgi:hypothetical protein
LTVGDRVGGGRLTPSRWAASRQTNLNNMQQFGIKGINEERTYEGEWNFICQPPCQGYLVEYSLQEFDNLASTFLTNTPLHALERCHLCRGPLEWTGYSGAMQTTSRIIALIKDEHYMASTVIVAAYIESALNNLLWAAFVDGGMNRELANQVVDNGKISRGEMINVIRSITGWLIKDIAFPVRNLVAHGKGFHRGEEFYKEELRKQAKEIRQWIERILSDVAPISFMPTEQDRWLLFMNIWSSGFVSFLESILPPAGK